MRPRPSKMLPRCTMPSETLTRLAAEAAQLRPATILLLGDTFHDGKAEERLGAEDRPYR